METSVIIKESWDGKTSADENWRKAMAIVLTKYPENKIIESDSISHKIVVVALPGDIKWQLQGIAFDFEDKSLGGRGKTMDDIDREEGD
jgi:hypothetical protein